MEKNFIKSGEKRNLLIKDMRQEDIDHICMKM